MFGKEVKTVKDTRKDLRNPAFRGEKMYYETHARLFTVAKTWKQPKQSTDEWIRKTRGVCIYTHNGVLAIKRMK